MEHTLLDGFLVFPEEEPLSLNNKVVIEQLNTQLGNNLSHLQFSNLFILDLDNTTSISRMGFNLVVSRVDMETGQRVYSLLGRDWIPVVEKMFELGVEAVELCPRPYGNFRSDPDNADYVYSVSKTSRLVGAEYAGFRRKLSLFRREAAGQKIAFKALGSCKYQLVWQVQRQWLEEISGMSKEAKYSAVNEQAALEKALVFVEELGLRIDVLEVGLEVVGFAVTEPIARKTLLIHFFKTSRRAKGAAEFLFWSLANKYRTELRWINFEQDLGLPGLKGFKKSLVPLEKKMVYTVRKNHESALTR